MREMIINRVGERMMKVIAHLDSAVLRSRNKVHYLCYSLRILHYVVEQSMMRTAHINYGNKKGIAA